MRLKLFESSEVLEKRAMLNFLLQNCVANGKKLEFDLRSPFDHILTFAKQPIELALLNDFRTFDWAEEYKYPTVILSQMKQLLAEHQEG
ncbi:MAG: hypothetical protein AAB822_00545 [Patescibacteria group bacterium]